MNEHNLLIFDYQKMLSVNQQIRCSIFQLLASVSLFLTIHCSAQKYISDFEKTIFQSYQKGSTDFSFIQGLFAIDSVSSSFIEYSVSLIDAEILKMPMREKKEKKKRNVSNLSTMPSTIRY